MKKKTDKTKEKDPTREVRLTVRLTPQDAERLDAVRSLMSPYAPISQGKAISAALKMAEDWLIERR